MNSLEKNVTLQCVRRGYSAARRTERRADDEQQTWRKPQILQIPVQQLPLAYRPQCTGGEQRSLQRQVTHEDFLWDQ